MQFLIHSEHQLAILPENVSIDKPDSYPCLAVGHWVVNDCGPDGYEYQYVYLIDESPENPNNPNEKYVIDLDKIKRY